MFTEKVTQDKYEGTCTGMCICLCAHMYACICAESVCPCGHARACVPVEGVVGEGLTSAAALSSAWQHQEGSCCLEGLSSRAPESFRMFSLLFWLSLLGCKMKLDLFAVFPQC